MIWMRRLTGVSAVCLGSFIGIVTRKDIIRYLSEQKSSLTLPEALKKIV